MSSPDISPDGTILNPQPQVEQRVVTPPIAPVVEPKVTPEAKIPDVEIPEVEVDFSDFQRAKDVNFVPEKKTDKPLEKKDDKPLEDKPAPELKTTDKPIVTVSKVPTARDLSDIPEEEHSVWKSMSNESFNKLKPMYVKAKQLEEKQVKLEQEHQVTKTALEEAQKGIVKLPENYYEHPSAFILTPEFQQLSQGLTLSQQIVQHWKGQKKAIGEGAKHVIVPRIQDGQLVADYKADVNDNTEELVEDRIEGAKKQASKFDASLETLANTHQAKYKENANWVDGYEKQCFEAFEKPENKPIYEPLVKDTLSNFPVALRNSPLAKLLAKSMVMNMALGKLLNQAALEKAKGGTATVDTKVIDKKKAGPTAGEADGGDGTSVATIGDDIEDFHKARRGEL